MSSPSEIVFCAGNLNYDLLFSTSRMPAEHEKLVCAGLAAQAGGAAANTAYWLASIGVHAAMLGAVGADPFGALCLDSLRSAGVDVETVVTAEGENTGITCIFTDGRSKRMVTNRGANSRFPLQRAAQALAKGGRHLHAAMNDAADCAELLRLAAAHGMTTSCECSGLLLQEIPRADLYFMNHDELCRLFESGEPLDAWRALCGGRQAWVIITEGERGARAVSGDAAWIRPARAVTPVDRTGGGDAFNAGFLGSFLAGEPVPAALDAGLALAAEVIDGMGARPARRMRQ